MADLKQQLEAIRKFDNKQAAMIAVACPVLGGGVTNNVKMFTVVNLNGELLASRTGTNEEWVKVETVVQPHIVKQVNDLIV